MKNKKGFTLIELLAVIIILGVLFVFIVPPVYRYIVKGRSEYYRQLEQTIKLAGRDYLNDYRSLLPREINNVTVVELEELIKNNYIKDVVDEDGNKCDARVTAKKINKGEYDYYSCLDCGAKYRTEGEACEFDESSNITTDTKNYSILVDDGDYEIDETGVYIVDQGSDFDLPLAKAYYKDVLVNDKVLPKPKIIDTNKLATTNVSYTYKGAVAEITVKVVDRVKPSVPDVVLRKDDHDGSIYKGNWYSGNIYEEFKSTDYTKKNILGSGIKSYEISVDNEIFITIPGNHHVSTINGNHTYYVRSVDNSGNVGDVNTYNLKIDKEVPVCSINVSNGTTNNGIWYVTDVDVNLSSDDKYSGVLTQNVSTDNVTLNGKNEVTGLVTDVAGNIGTCKLDVYVDKEAPVVSAEIKDADKQTFEINNLNQAILITASDNYSGIDFIQYQIYYNGNLVDSNDQLSNSTYTINLNNRGTWNIKVKAKDVAGNWSGDDWSEFEYIVNDYLNKEWLFDYTGDVQSFTAPTNGTYKLEVWGAQGTSKGILRGGYGGYSTGTVQLNSNDTLYVVVGGRSSKKCTSYDEDGDCSNNIVPAAYNGGAAGYNGWGAGYGGAGGGATHIATTDRGVLANYVNNQSEVLIVAGGGGGFGNQATESRNSQGNGKDAGGYQGTGTKWSISSSSKGYPSGTQTTGGLGEYRKFDDESARGKNGSFGLGGKAACATHTSGFSCAAGAGGGGWYGGGGACGEEGSTNNKGGGGGSGYIGNTLLSNKVMYCYNCDESTDTDTKTTSTTNVSETAISNYAKQGTGYARITFVSN